MANMSALTWGGMRTDLINFKPCDGIGWWYWPCFDQACVQ